MGHEPFLVLTDDSLSPAVNGGILHDFLSVSHRCRLVVLRADDSCGPEARCDVLFVNAAMKNASEKMSRVRAGRTIFFDYYDELERRIHPENEAFLQRERFPYFKTSRCKTDGVAEGLLPIAMPGGLGRVLDVRRRRFFRNPFRLTDICFHGRATFFEGRDGARYHQRVEWVLEADKLRGVRKHLGLIPLYGLREELSAQYPSLRSGLWKEAESYSKMFRRLESSKIALAPTGHARWTYRHVEALYAGAVVVSNDLSEVETLLEWPGQAMVSVSDHMPIEPVIRAVLANYRQHADRVSDGVAVLERQMADGRWCRSLPASFNRFVAQIEPL